MAYVEGKPVHRYLGHPPCVEVVVVKIYPDSRCLLDDGSIINRFTKSYYHAVEECPVPRLIRSDPKGAIIISFPTAVETRRTPSRTKPDKEPYTTQRLSNGTFQCNCPRRTYHPIDDCVHIRDWKAALAQSPG